MRTDLPGSLDLQKCVELVPEFCNAPFLRNGGKKERWCCASGSRWRAAHLDGIFHKSLIARSALPEPACNRFDRMFQLLFQYSYSIPYAALFLFLPSAPGSAVRSGATRPIEYMGCIQGSPKLERLRFRQKSFAILFLGNPSCRREQQICKCADAARLRCEYQNRNFVVTIIHLCLH